MKHLRGRRGWLAVICLAVLLSVLSLYGVSAAATEGEKNIGAANQAARFEAEGILNQLIIQYQIMEPDTDSARWGGVERAITQYGKNRLNELVSDDRYQTDSLAVEIDLYRASGVVAGEVTWVYYTYIDEKELSAESREAITAVYTTICEEIGKVSLTSHTDITRSFANQGFVARMYVSVYDAKLDALLQEGDSRAVADKVIAAKDALRVDTCLPVVVEGQVCTSPEAYERVFMDCARAVKVQRWQDTAMAQLTDVFSVLYPEADLMAHEGVLAALAALDDDAADTVAVLNATLVDTVGDLLDALDTFGDGYIAAYIEGVKAQMSEAVTAANTANRVVDVLPFFKDHDMAYAKAYAKDELAAHIRDLTEDEPWEGDAQMEQLADEYNRAGGLFDACADPAALAYEQQRARLRADLCREYLYSDDIINRYGGEDGKDKEALLAEIRGYYSESESKLSQKKPVADEQKLQEQLKECQVIYDDCIAKLRYAAAEAEVVAFLTEHKEIIEKPAGEVTVADQDKLEAAVAAVSAMNERARDILLEKAPLVAAALADKYVRVAKELVQGYLDTAPRDTYIPALKDALDAQTLKDNDPDHLAALVAEVDAIVHKAVCIDRVYDALDAIETSDDYGAFPDARKQELRKIADEAVAAIASYAPTGEEDGLAGLTSLADEAVRALYRLTVNTMADEAVDAIGDKGFLPYGKDGDGEDLPTQKNYVAKVEAALQAALEQISSMTDLTELAGGQETLSRALSQLLDKAAEEDLIAEGQVKEKAHADVQTAYDAAVEYVNGKVYLSDDDSATLLARAEECLSLAREQIDKAKTTAAVMSATEALKKGLNALKNDTDAKDVETSEALRAAAEADVQAQRDEILALIDGMPYIPDQNKAAAKQAVVDAMTAFATALQEAASPAEIAAAQHTAQDALYAARRDAELTDLAEAKRVALHQLMLKEEEVAGTVDGFVYLDDAAIDDLTARRQLWSAAAAKAVNDATTVNGVHAARDAHLQSLDAYAEEAQSMEDEACVRTLTPILTVLLCILVAELLALGILCLLRYRQKSRMQVAAYLPLSAIPVMALALTPVSAWVILVLTAVADVALIPVIVWVAIKLWQNRIVVQLEEEDGIRILEEPIGYDRKRLPDPGAVARLDTPKLIYLMPPAEVMPETVPAITMEEADELISDEDALNCEESGLEDTEVYHGRKKAEINIDVLSRFFEAGDTITLNSMKRKGLLPRSVGHVKVLARGRLDKSITVIAQGFSASAVKMIVLTGGKAVLTEGAPERWTWRRRRKR